MSAAIPRRQIDELEARWQYAKIYTVLVEGEFDQRFLRLIQNEEYCIAWLRELDCLDVGLVDVPPELLAARGLNSDGAKQRVVALGREIEYRGAEEGFRGIVDVDLDVALNLDFQSTCVLYTDHSCLDAYLWTVEVLKRLIVQFKCEEKVATKSARRALFDDINMICRGLTAVRIVQAQHAELGLEVLYSDASLTMVNGRIALNLPKYVEQCRPRKGTLNEARRLVLEARDAISEFADLDIINGHDLVWFLAWALKKLTGGKKLTISEDAVSQSLVGFGVMDKTILEKPLFRNLGQWCGA